MKIRVIKPKRSLRTEDGRELGAGEVAEVHPATGNWAAGIGLAEIIEHDTIATDSPAAKLVLDQRSLHELSRRDGTDFTPPPQKEKKTDAGNTQRAYGKRRRKTGDNRDD